MLPRTLILAAVLTTALNAQWVPDNPVTGVTRQPDGATLALQRGTLRLQVCTDSIARIRYSPTGSFPDQPNGVIIKQTWPEVKVDVQQDAKEVVLTTSRM